MTWCMSLHRIEIFHKIVHISTDISPLWKKIVHNVVKC
jgi:hypothetical protein